MFKYTRGVNKKETRRDNIYQIFQTKAYLKENLKIENTKEIKFNFNKYKELLPVFLMNSIPEENLKGINVDETVNINHVLKAIQYGSTFKTENYRFYIFGSDKDIVMSYLLDNELISIEETISNDTYIINPTNLLDNHLSMLSSYEVTLIIVTDDSMYTFYDGEKSVGEVFMFDLGLYIHLASKIPNINYAEMLMYYIIRNFDTYHLTDMKMLMNSNLFESIKKSMRDAYGFNVSIDIHVRVINYLIQKNLLSKFLDLNINQVKQLLPRGHKI